MIQTASPTVDIKHLVDTAQMLVDKGLIPAAEGIIKTHKLNLKIINGKVVDQADQTEFWLSQFITTEPRMLSLKEDVRKLAKVNDEVLIIGPTGTGKELLAKALHGSRPERKFKAINCAGLPEHLIESELFGHKRGAFTGAHTEKIGIMSLASSDEDYAAGTFFLDEVGELPLVAQAKLLRALQERTIRKVGGETDEEIDCRIVCATNKSIFDMVERGEFRLDLYARISVFELHTLGLNERIDDIKLIIESLPYGKEFYSKLDLTKKLDLPFNVRSLQAMIKRYKVLGKLP